MERHFVGRKKKRNRKENETERNGGKKKGTYGTYINTENSLNKDQDSWTVS